MKKVVRNQAGFSLIELMIVVAIIGILATIAIPNFKRFQTKSKQSEAKEELGGIYVAEKAFFNEWSEYYADMGAIGYCPEGQLNYRVGFQAAGATNTPSNYSGAGGITANAPAVAFVTSAAATIAACPSYTENVSSASAGPQVLTAAYSGTLTAVAFTAEANGIVNGASADDWTMTENKVLFNNVSGL